MSSGEREAKRATPRKAALVHFKAVKAALDEEQTYRSLPADPLEKPCARCNSPNRQEGHVRVQRERRRGGNR